MAPSSVERWRVVNVLRSLCGCHAQSQHFLSLWVFVPGCHCTFTYPSTHDCRSDFEYTLISLLERVKQGSAQNAVLKSAVSPCLANA